MKKKIALLSIKFFFTCIAFSQLYKGQIDSTVLPGTGPAHYIPEYDI